MSAAYRQSRFWNEGNLIAGNALAFAFDGNAGNFLFGGTLAQTPPADGDTVELLFNVSPGNYTLRVYGGDDQFTPGDSGIQDIYFDGVLVGTIDRSAVNVSGVVVFPVTVTGPVSVFRAVINGTNSTDFFAHMQRVSLVRV